MPSSTRGVTASIVRAAIDAARAVSWVGGIVGMQKSFRQNPVLGSPWLNRRGLHRERVRLAARLAASRRGRLAHRLLPADLQALTRDGFVVKRNFLPEVAFRKLREELLSGPLPAHEMRQGQTVTRVLPIVPLVGKRLSVAASVATDPALRALLGFAAGRFGAPVWFVQTILANPCDTDADPQTDLHADTFHPTSKAWLFLHDVGEDDGPLMLVPGSHRLTARRLEWEHRQSLTARDDARLHHSLGSFRLTPADVEYLGCPSPRAMTVPANTLVVADTFGFHARSRSCRPTLRMELHGSLRRNPFVPWNGLDWHGLPGIRDRQFALFLALEDALQRYMGSRSIWQNVGAVRIDAPPQI